MEKITAVEEVVTASIRSSFLRLDDALKEFLTGKRPSVAATNVQLAYRDFEKSCEAGRELGYRIELHESQTPERWYARLVEMDTTTIEI